MLGAFLNLARPLAIKALQNPNVLGTLLVGSVGAQQADEIQNQLSTGNISLDDVYNTIVNFASSPVIGAINEIQTTPAGEVYAPKESEIEAERKFNEELNRSEGRSLPNPYNQAERIIDRIINKNYKINLSDESKSLTDIDVPQPSIFQQESRITTPPLNTAPVDANIINTQAQNAGLSLPANFASLSTADKLKTLNDLGIRIR